MSTGLVPVVETVVDEKVQAGEMFTAYDVTKEVRSRGHKAYHDPVKTAVHDYFNRGGMGVAYTRTPIPLAGATPFLYHRTADDPSTYATANGLQTTAPPIVTTIVVPPAQDDDDDDDVTNTVSSVAGVAVSAVKCRNSLNSAVGRRVDARGTLSLPVKLLQQAGFKPHQKVCVVPTVSGADVVDAATATTSVGRKYTVDRSTQVRITQATLRRAGLGGSVYDCIGDHNKVTVKLH